MLKRVHDGKAKTIFSGVAGAAGTAGSSRSDKRVRAVGAGDSELGQAGGLDEGTRTDGLKTDEQEELARLRRENARLKEEREILSKARGLVRAGGREEVKAIFFFIDAHQAMFSIRGRRLL
jgi:transposase-like protein